ncbi:MAG TPA: hydrogenase maturation nickel metallochaperone HypA [Gemmatimonadaceae bacterium]|nr:hydrogenase maturation nickel metallochaperone HypA [Gemmatimonadaceae bacterium]
MHELAIAVSLVEIATEEGGRLGGRVCAVHVKIGQLAGVVKDALAFSYDIAAQDTPMAGSKLVIEEADGRELELVALEIES